MASKLAKISSGTRCSLEQAGTYLLEAHERFHGQEVGGGGTSPLAGSPERRNEADPGIAASRAVAFIQGRNEELLQEHS